MKATDYLYAETLRLFRLKDSGKIKTREFFGHLKDAHRKASEIETNGNAS
jgi:hypothetical protein